MMPGMHPAIRPAREEDALSKIFFIVHTYPYGTVGFGMQKASSRPGLPKVHAFGMGLFIITLNTYARHPLNSVKVN
jgi:hypothetical protein